MEEPITGPVIVPAVTATPRGAAILADKLGESIAILETWNIRIASASKLPTAERLLRQIADLPAYPEEDRLLLRIGNVIRIAFDFYHITRCLTEDRVDAIAEDVRRSIKGTVDDSGPTEANRAQSQVLIAAVMAVGGLKPAAPQLEDGQTPDYVVVVDTLPFGVEIKRPASKDQVLKRVDQAIDQITAFGSEAGLIVVDLSDCLLGPTSQTAVTRSDVQPTFRAAYTDISEHVAKSERAGSNRIANLFVFANLFAWERRATPVPAPLFLMYSEVFPLARAGLIVKQARRLREQIDQGFKVFGGEVLERRRVGWRPGARLSNDRWS